MAVSRRELTDGESEGYGFAYTVTFVGAKGGRRWVGDVAPLRVSTDASEYLNPGSASPIG